MRFPIVVHKDADSGYGVTVPDLPGCFSAGDTLDEVIESAREAIACHIEGLLLDGEPVPARASLEAHQGNDDYRGGVWAIAEVDISKLSSKTKRINITLPERVLAIVDQAAVREGQSRSGLLARAALSYLQRQSAGDLSGLLTDRPDSSHAYGADSAQQTPRRRGDGE
ncbi:type II toxin-antitoxin system HicB family antitoxin [Candidatus Palauibacter sp.]|uniref:type II toxin-antitoxin system HicB family antitoxin n=1 Tax=Candidatus Palauibacter sp. TaxID=3101350 RepID=UPI003AF2027A